MTPNPAILAQLDPIHRAEFDVTPIKRWRITWALGGSEIIEGHLMSTSGDTVRFHWNYLGPHRIVNMQHVRDIAELGDDDYPEALLADPPDKSSDPPRG